MTVLINFAGVVVLVSIFGYGFFKLVKYLGQINHKEKDGE
jgi:hypothetical protein